MYARYHHLKYEHDKYYLGTGHYNYGEGVGATKWVGGGGWQVKLFYFTPIKRGGGKSLSHAEGGHTKVLG